MRKRLFAMLATAAIVVAACGGTTSQAPSDEPSTEPTAEPTPTPEVVRLDDSTYNDRVEEGVDGGQIIIGDWQEANLFNPYYLGQVTEANVASAAWATFVVLTDDYRYAPDLATSVPTVDSGGVTVGEGGDAMTVTWDLRPDLKWSDGETLDCDDFLYAHEWVMDPENVGVITTGYDISEPECTSASQLVLHYSEIFEGYITQNVAPLPRHYLGDIPMADQVQGAGFRADEVPDLPVSGAFKFESVTPLAELRLTRNDNYTSFSTGKPAHLDSLVWKWYGDADLMIAGFAAGEIDFATDLQDSDIPKLDEQGLHDQTSAIPALLYEFLRPNWSAGPFSDASPPGSGGCSRNPVVADRGDLCPMADPAVRAAIPFAIDKNEINTRLLGGTVQVANTSISPSAWFFADQTPATFDPEQAKTILEEAGWVDSDGDGVREKDGTKLKIELCTTTRQVRIDTLALIASWLGDVGFEAIPNPVPAADIFAAYNEATVDTPCALATSNFDLAEHAFSSSIDPLGSYFSYHSTQFEPQGANDAQVVDDGIDAALDTVKTSVDFVAIRHAMAEFQTIYVEKTVEIPLYYRKNVELVSERLGNFFANPTQAGPTWNAVDWYFKG